MHRIRREQSRSDKSLIQTDVGSELRSSQAPPQQNLKHKREAMATSLYIRERSRSPSRNIPTSYRGRSSRQAPSTVTRRNHASPPDGDESVSPEDSDVDSVYQEEENVAELSQNFVHYIKEHFSEENEARYVAWPQQGAPKELDERLRQTRRKMESFKGEPVWPQQCRMAHLSRVRFGNWKSLYYVKVINA